MKQFNAGVTSDLATVFSALLATKMGPAVMRDYPVGGVKLSDRLYANAQAVSATTRNIIEQHMKGPHSARELAKTLYEGYNFKEDELKVIAGLPKYLKVEFNKAMAARLKTPALRAAYLQAIRAAEAGKGTEQLAKVLKIAFYERNRYFANRIARTELHRAFSEQRSREFMETDRIHYVQLRLSSKHPKTDICDLHTSLDAYGLGPGVYPKAQAPQPPFHPHCLCLIAPMIALSPKLKPRFNEKAEQAFLQALPPNEARLIAGSREKLERALKGESLEDIHNEGKDALYQWKRVGDVVAQSAPMLSNSPSELIEQRIAEAAQRYTKQLDSLPFDRARAVAQQAVDDPLFEQFFEQGIAGNYPVGALRSEDMALLGTTARAVHLSARSLREHLEKHPEIQLQDYQKIPLILEQGEVWELRDKPERLIYLWVDGVVYRAALKRTQTGDENYFLTLFKNTKKKPPKGAVKVR